MRRVPRGALERATAGVSPGSAMVHRDRSKSWRALSVALAISITAVELAAAQPLPATLEACTRIGQDFERLACFDRELATLSHGARKGGPAAPSVATVPSQPTATGGSAASSDAVRIPTAPAPLTREQKFGLSPEGVRKLEAKQGIKHAEAPEVAGVTAHVARIAHSASGRIVFTLDNGQVWRQAELRSSFETAPGEAVTISKGALGAFRLVTSRHKWTSVERIP